MVHPRAAQLSRALVFAFTALLLSCGAPHDPPRRGPILKVNIKIESRGSLHCPVPSGITALPQEAHVGASLTLEGFATNNAGAHFAWSGGGGAFSAKSSRITTFTCTELGDHALTFTVQKTGCSDTAMPVVVTCTGLDSDGTAGVGR